MIHAQHEQPPASVGNGTPDRPRSLRLTRLTLNGFKSFADRTAFTFDEAITGIVGPNGCGKSNLVDAIKWVLGERSSKSLRGKEMIDVIFAGSAGRKPAGMASVTLTFENPVLPEGVSLIGMLDAEDAEDGNTDRAAPASSGSSADSATSAPEPAGEDDEPGESVLADRRRVRRPLPIDADEVSVERQLFRDGTSRYLINGRRARLRDIRDLFLDTGIGADAYSIIEQGKVDAMLLASPQERRTIFEEAAGIAKYKQRRIEAQRKLDRAEANLSRTREMLDSTERRLRIVRGQAAKARRFRELDGECSALRLAVAFDQYDEVCQRLAAMTSRLQALEIDRDRAHEDLASSERAMQESELAVSEAMGDLRRIEDAVREGEHAGATARQRRQLGERAIEEAARQLELDRQRLHAAEALIGALESDLNDQRGELAAIAERASEAERALDEATSARGEAMGAIASTRHEREQARSRLAGMEREQQTLRSEADSIAHRLEELVSQRGRLDDRLAALTRDRDSSASEQESARAALGRRDDAIAGLEREFAALSERGETLAGARRSRAERVDRLAGERVGLDARRATLDEMVRSRAGLAEGAKWVMERREGGDGFAGVVAPLAELVETASEHASAVEAALGSDLQALVTRSIVDGPTPEERAGLPGRVRFLPLRGLRAPAGSPRAAPEAVPASHLTPVRTLVKAHDGDEAVSMLLDRLLARTYLVEDLDAALLLSAGAFDPGVRFVTRSGEVLGEHGCIDAGPPGAEQGGGLIRRASELAELEARLGVLTAALDGERNELERLDAAWGEVNDRREKVSSDLAEQRRLLAGEQARLDRLEAELTRVDREIASVNEELGKARARGEEMEAARGVRLEKADSLERLAIDQRAALSSLNQQLSDLERRAEAAGERMSAAREEAGRANAERDGARRELSRLEQSLDAARDSRQEHERHAEQARARHELHEATIREATEELARAEAALLEARGVLDGARSRADHADLGRQRAGAALAGARERARLVERDWHGVEATRREFEVKRENLEERTLEDLRIDLAAEYPEYRAMMADRVVVRIDIPDAQARINVLRAEIGKLGHVNLDAIAEEGQLSEADEGLRAQLADLDAARCRLTDLIERLNIASRERFGEVFTLIREHFGGQDGMFRRLFGGGRAEVRLMGLVKEIEEADGTIRKVVTEQTDLLESGIEVIAKPPGKEPRSISQLSGGEKTLTAVALLMAIFRSKPSCFCVLDEVDAALDESNVGRFCQTVRAFTDQSSFIVITHNKKTMQMADHLYGVTQQERGVSKRVSVRFDHVAPDGSFRVSEYEPERASAQSPDPAEPVDPAAASQAVPSPSPANGNGNARPSGGLRRALAAMREQTDGTVAVEP
jgi:chromosome segregation protein